MSEVSEASGVEYISDCDDDFYSVDSSLEDAGYETPVAGPCSAHILEEEWRTTMQQYHMNTIDHCEEFQILKQISKLPKMAATIRSKGWFAPTLELVAWLVAKRQAACALDQLESKKRIRRFKEGRVRTKWYLFGGPVRLPMSSFHALSEEA